MASSRKKIKHVSVKKNKQVNTENVKHEDKNEMLNEENTNKLIKFGTIFLIIGYVICMILTINYSIQTNIAVDELFTTMVGQTFNNDDYNKLKNYSHSLVVTVGVFLLTIIIVLITCLFLKNSNKLTILICYIVILTVMILFPVILLSFASRIVKEINNLQSETKTLEDNDSFDNVTRNNNNVIITSILGLIFAIILVVLFSVYKFPELRKN